MKLNKIFSFLSNLGRKSVLTVDVTVENGEQKELVMENEKNVEQQPVEKVEEKKEEVVENKEEPTQPNAQGECNGECEKEQQQEQIEQEVNNTEPLGNGIPIDQVVLKEDLQAAMAALNSKLDAVLDENKKLKDKLAEKDSEINEKNGTINEMKNKYEDNDFGSIQKQGVQSKDNKANDTFDEYSKQFM